MSGCGGRENCSLGSPRLLLMKLIVYLVIGRGKAVRDLLSIILVRDSIQQNRQQDLLRLLDEFRELQGLPPLPEELHVVVGERSSQISRDRLTKHQGTVSRLVQREKESNLTPEQRAEDLVNFCESLADDLDLAQDSESSVGIRSKINTAINT